MQQEYRKSTQELLESLQSTENGLSSTEAKARLEKYGYNKQRC